MLKFWYRERLHIVTFVLLPFSWIFGFICALRRLLYRSGFLKSYRFSVPVWVVGNITVGGTGKTPFVLWLAAFLRAQGLKPGIVSRGVGGANQVQPYWVNSHDRVEQVGDEALLLAQHANCPVVVCIDRVAAVKTLLRQTDCNIVISDDGLQHYRLARDLEIAMVDGTRRFGNGKLLPAGPLRETAKRLNKVDFVVVNAGNHADSFRMELAPLKFHALKPGNTQQLTAPKIHAVAGIGNPQRFFQTLKTAGFEIIPHEFPDHYLYQPQDIHFDDDLPIVMTEKDAVKCRTFADERHWYLQVAAKVNAELEREMLKRLT